MLRSAIRQGVALGTYSQGPPSLSPGVGRGGGGVFRRLSKSSRTSHLAPYERLAEMRTRAKSKRQSALRRPTPCTRLLPHSGSRLRSNHSHTSLITHPPPPPQSTSHYTPASSLPIVAHCNPFFHHPCPPAPPPSRLPSKSANPCHFRPGPTHERFNVRCCIASRNGRLATQGCFIFGNVWRSMSPPLLPELLPRPPRHAPPPEFRGPGTRPQIRPPSRARKRH